MNGLETDLERADFIIARGHIPTYRVDDSEHPKGWLRIAEMAFEQTFPNQPYKEFLPFQTLEVEVFNTNFQPRCLRYGLESPIEFTGKVVMHDEAIVLSGELYRSGQIWGRGKILSVASGN